VNQRRQEKCAHAHAYSFTFESRRADKAREHVNIAHYNWRSAQTMALTRVATKTKTSRAMWRMVYMEQLS